MKIVGVGCGVIVLVGVVFLVWWSRHPIVFRTPTGLPKVTARQLPSAQPGTILVEAALSGSSDGFFIDDISCPVIVVQTLGLGPPVGFHVEPLPLEEDDRKDPTMVAFVEKWNAENVRWAGSLPLQPGVPVALLFPSSALSAVGGKLTISYERRGHFGGMSAATTVELNPSPNGSEATPDQRP